MSSSVEFCSCKNMDCPLHHTKHDKGCTPCISKNLRLKEIPNCFFDLIDGAESREGDSFEDFTKLILSDKKEMKLF